MTRQIEALLTTMEDESCSGDEALDGLELQAQREQILSLRHERKTFGAGPNRHGCQQGCAVQNT